MFDPAGAELATKLRQLEHLLDAAHAAGGELAVAVSRARHAHKVSAVADHSIVKSFGEASSAIIQARGSVVRGHRLLEQLARTLNVPYAYGDEMKDSGDKKG